MELRERSRGAFVEDCANIEIAIGIDFQLDEHSNMLIMITSRNRWLIRALVALVLLWPFAAWLAATELIVALPPIQNADAIVVMSGSATYRERTMEAASLYKSGIAHLIILTNDGSHGGWSSPEQRNPLFVERAHDNLIALDVPDKAIEIIREPVYNTYIEAERVRDFSVKQGFHSLIVVTSAYHSRRATWTLQKVFAGTGIQVSIQSVPAGDETPLPAVWWFFPTGWQFVALEWVKVAYYHIKY